MTDSKDTCESCRSYAGNAHERGQCRRYPPTVSNGRSSHPYVELGAWCREFEEAPLEPHPYDDCCMCEEFCAPTFHRRREAARDAETAARIAKLSRWERWVESWGWWGVQL